MLATGTRVSPDYGAPTVEDMAVNLPRICRFAGNGWDWFPVGLHTFIVCDLLPPELKAYGLVHDGSEGVGNDVPSPVKIPAISEQENKIFSRILHYYNLPQLTSEQEKRLKVADTLALWGEVWAVGPPGLRSQYRRIEFIEKLTLDYLRRYPVTECTKRGGTFGIEFQRRWKVYRAMASYARKPGMPELSVTAPPKVWP